MRMILQLLIYLWVMPTSTIGLVLALLALLTGGSARGVGGILEVHGGIVRLFLRYVVGLFLRGGASAMTLGHVIIGRDAQCLELSRAHERVHVRQCERWGPLFLPAYLLGSIWALCRGGQMYRDNPFEREAYSKG